MHAFELEASRVGSVRALALERDDIGLAAFREQIGGADAGGSGAEDRHLGQRARCLDSMRGRCRSRAHEGRSTAVFFETGSTPFCATRSAGCSGILAAILFASGFHTNCAITPISP